jgi:alkylation response protein AidB-like acyl-CoA dehydrogenase
MDFTPTEEQLAVSASADAVFSELARVERVAEVEKSDDRFDPVLWAALARSDLLGIALPEKWGGAGLGMLELCSLLEAQGKRVAPVPLWSTLVTGALTLEEHASDPIKERYLPGVVSGDSRLTAALSEPVAVGWADAVERARATYHDGSSRERDNFSSGLGSSGMWTGPRARRVGGRWLVRGVARAVPQAHLAAAAVAFAVDDDGETLAFVVDLGGEGVWLERAVTTDRQVHPHLHLEDVAIDDRQLLGGPGLEVSGTEVAARAITLGRTGLAALSLGVCEEALSITAHYVDEREQFGRSLSSFQGVKLRIADAAIDIEAMRVTMLEAVWRLATGRPAGEAVAVAHLWASEAGQRVVHATQHLHGGVGADVSYPIHRYFLWAKQIELMLGSPSLQMAELGRILSTRALAGPSEGGGSTSKGGL